MNAADSGLKETVIEEISAMGKRCGVEKLVLFGSRAKGTWSRASDIDLAVYGGDVDRFAADAEETVQTLLRFDVVDMNGRLSPGFREQIEREGVVLYEKV